VEATIVTATNNAQLLLELYEQQAELTNNSEALDQLCENLLRSHMREINLSEANLKVKKSFYQATDTFTEFVRLLYQKHFIIVDNSYLMLYLRKTAPLIFSYLLALNFRPAKKVKNRKE
jgi:hypothetical protein